jgi:hypothetical protein
MSDNINCLAKSKLNSVEITELKMNVGLRRVPLTDKTGSCLCLKIIQKFKCYLDYRNTGIHFLMTPLMTVTATAISYMVNY